MAIDHTVKHVRRHQEGTLTKLSIAAQCAILAVLLVFVETFAWTVHSVCTAATAWTTAANVARVSNLTDSQQHQSAYRAWMVM